MQQQTHWTFVPQRNVDALCMALGKKDSRGSVYGVGGLNIGYRKAFGKPDRRVTGLRLNQQSMEKIKEEVKASLMEEFEQKLKDVESQVREQLLSMMQQNGGLKFPEDSDLSQTPGSDLPPPMLKVNKLVNDCEKNIPFTINIILCTKVLNSGGISFKNMSSCIRVSTLNSKCETGP